MPGREHSLEKGKVHHKWDKTNPPAIEIDPGDTVHCETIDVTNNQITPTSQASALATLDFSQLYPLAGPIFVRGAKPGDVLEVEILRMQTLGWGYAAIIPGLGLLDEDFTRPYIRHFDLTNTFTTAFARPTPLPLTRAVSIQASRPVRGERGDGFCAGAAAGRARSSRGATRRRSMVLIPYSLVNTLKVRYADTP